MPSSSDRGTGKGLGSKYGSTLRKRYSRIMGNLKRTRRCPSCGSPRFRRESVGIWSCNTCKFKVAGEAYDVGAVKA
ncbi:MAG: 50S ribosomal protein L37 [Nitrososphaerota archaeon]|nr:50S ribosomal protein L37 [Nitrososphaerota archaeon]